VGDVGDFGKYGLLRARTGEFPKAEPRLSLVVVWYHNPDQVGSPDDGKKRKYLDQPKKFAACDEHLFEFLKELDSRDSRGIVDIERSGILGLETRFLSWPERSSLDVVFLDPDKGLAFTPSQRSLEHAYLPEAEIDDDQTVVVYQSFGRSRGDTHERQMERWSGKLESQLPNHAAPQILRFRPAPPRSFLVVPSMRNRELIDYRLAALLGSTWGGYFTLHRDDPSRDVP